MENRSLSLKIYRHLYSEIDEIFHYLIRFRGAYEKQKKILETHVQESLARSYEGESGIEIPVLKFRIGGQAGKNSQELSASKVYEEYVKRHLKENDINGFVDVVEECLECHPENLRTESLMWFRGEIQQLTFVHAFVQHSFFLFKAASGDWMYLYFPSSKDVPLGIEVYLIVWLTCVGQDLPSEGFHLREQKPNYPMEDLWLTPFVVYPSYLLPLKTSEQEKNLLGVFSL